MRLKELLNNSQEPTLIITHRNADLDGFVSTILIYRYLRSIGLSKIIISIPEGISKSVKDFLTKMKMKHYDEFYIDDFNKLVIRDFDTLIIVDVSSIVQIGNFTNVLNRVKRVLWIDHHSIRSDNIGVKDLHIVADKYATSTCEIIYREIPELVDIVDRDLAILSIAAILIDSRRFSKANATTFEILSNLLKKFDIEFENIVNALFSRELPFDEKMARIKGIMRMEAYRFDNNILCISHVSAHEASLARVLLDAGCDIAVVVSEHDEEFRIIARTKLNNISMAELCRKISTVFNGQGGGHDKAGAAAIPKSQDVWMRKIMRSVVQTISEMVGIKLRKVRPR